jgi:hypothetical protein
MKEDDEMRADRASAGAEGLEWGDLLVEFETFPAGLDTAPLLKGLPDDRCPCPHWGYVFKGRFVVRYAGHEETVSAGEAFYMAPGHAPLFLEDTEMFELSPAAELRQVLEVVNANAAALDEALWEQR